MASIGYSGPWGKLICERKKKLKISCQAPFKVETSGDLIFLPGIVVFACDFDSFLKILFCGSDLQKFQMTKLSNKSGVCHLMSCETRVTFKLQSCQKMRSDTEKGNRFIAAQKRQPSM
jgi:hypothetical protein